MSMQTYYCPTCGAVMAEYKDEDEDDTENDTEYEKTMFRCKNCDTWVTLEVPVPDSGSGS